MIENIFTENLVDEPDSIERVIEDGEQLRRDSDGESDDEDKKKDEKEKENEKQKIRKKIGPRPVLNAQRLIGPHGIATIKKFYSGVKLSGRRGLEARDLSVVMKRLELWTHQLYPRGHFDDSLKKIETLGNKKIVKNYVTRIRLGLEDESGVSDLVREEPKLPPHGDPFDQLVSSTTGPEGSSGSKKAITTEQRERMVRNRLVAEERRAARIKEAQELKERFKAEQALKQRQEMIERTSPMDVDDNHVSR